MERGESELPAEKLPIVDQSLNDSKAHQKGSAVLSLAPRSLALTGAASALLMMLAAYSSWSVQKTLMIAGILFICLSVLLGLVERLLILLFLLRVD